MEELTPIQLRVLGCLLEKKETTPDQYPLTLNALRNACNQKTSRQPVTAYEEGEVGHALRELEALGLVREEWGARAPKYMHRAGQALGVYQKGLAVLCVLMLRGPQTLGELKTNTQRLFDFEDLEEVKFTLDDLGKKEPPMVTVLPRQPGQKEERFAHLLGGEPDVPAPIRAPLPPRGHDSLAERVATLEAEVQRLEARLAALEPRED